MSLLGLAAYGSSSEDEENDQDPVVAVKPTPVSVKRKDKVKIMAPSLSSVKDNDSEGEPPRKKKTANTASTSLFSKLPAPKNMVGRGKEANRALIPHVFRRKPEEKKPPAKAQSRPSSATVSKKSSVSSDPVEEDEGDEPVTNFFSFVDKDEDAKTLAKAESLAETQQTSTATTSSNELNFPYSYNNAHSAHTTASPYTTGQPTVSYNYSYSKQSQQHTETSAHTPQDNTAQQKPDSWIDPRELARLSGRRGKKEMEQINFIDVNADSALEGNQELLLKSISEEKNMNRISHSKKKNKDMPSSQQKRKHQLSYLIHQAKAREVELKQSWAEGHAKRDVVKQRYGF